jgi:hypothetical protein
VIHVVTAEITTEGEFTMTTPNTVDQVTLATLSETQELKTVTKPNAAPRKPHVAPTRDKSPHKAGRSKNAPAGHKMVGRGSKKPKSSKTAGHVEKPFASREGSKGAQILDLLKRPGGATLQEIMKVSEWQPHSVRGFISGTLGKKMGLTVESTKSDGGERTYSIKA